MLKRRTPLQRGGGLKPVSAKRARINKVYGALRKKFLDARPYCEWWLKEHGCTLADMETNGCVQWNNGFTIKWLTVPKSEDVHHRKGRGKYLLDTSTWLAVSRAAHNHIHTFTKESYDKGYLLPR